MANSAPSKKHLRLYTEHLSKLERQTSDAVGSLPALLTAFRASTGHGLRFISEPDEKVQQTALTIPVPGSAEAQGYLLLERLEKLSPDNSSAATKKMAESLADLVGELLQTRDVVRMREAELAAGVPVIPHAEEEKHLSARLESILRAGAEAVECDAAALYLLDEGTTELKLRSSWGLPFDRLTAPPRSLQGSVADLEALLGHAVVLDDNTGLAAWHAPEDFPAAVCVPVSSPTTLLGTLWCFCDHNREFDDRQTNILEITAGRIAADLEREMLLRVGYDGANLQKEVLAAERVQRNELPTISPLIDGWEIAGWTAQAGNLGGAFHDWFSVPGGLLGVMVGQAAQQGIAGALTAGTVRMALRSHARYQREADRLLAQANLTLWTGSAGDRHSAMFFAFVETATGRLCCSSAGGLSVLRLQRNGWESLSQEGMVLGESPEAEFEQFGYELQPDEALVIIAAGSSYAGNPQRRATREAQIADALHQHPEAAAGELAAAARAILEGEGAGRRCDRSVLVVKRKG